MDRDVGKDGRRDSPKQLEKGTNAKLLMALLFISDAFPRDTIRSFHIRYTLARGESRFGCNPRKQTEKQTIPPK